MNSTMKDSRMPGPDVRMSEDVSRMQEDLIDEALSRCTARVYAYSLFSRVFGAEPDEQVTEALKGVLVKQAWGVLASACPTDTERIAFSDRAMHDAACSLNASEYLRLFVGPATPLAPPWESVYVSASGSLFTKDTLGVRAFYREFGFRACGYPREADDHLATELTFMAELCKEELAALQAADWCRAAWLHEGQSRFLEEHPMRWMPLFAERLFQQAPDSCYAVLSKAVCDYVRLDRSSRLLPASPKHGEEIGKN